MSLFSAGMGQSNSDYSSRSSNSVWKPQGSALKDMYGYLPGLMDMNMGQLGGFNNFAMNQVMPYMQGLINPTMGGYQNQLQGGQQGNFANAMSPQLQQSLMQSLNGPQGQTNTQRMFQDIVGGQGNEYIDPVVNDMYDTMWDQLDRGGFKDQAQQAAQTGNMGNYNRQMNNTLLANDALQNTQRAENQLRAGAYDTDLNWKMNIANQADTNSLNDRMNAQNNLMGMYGGADQNIQAGMGNMAGMQQFGMGMMNPWMAMQQMPWMGANNYANVLGSPIMESKTRDKGGSWGHSGSFGMF